MSTVTGRIRQVKKPGRFIKPSQFSVREMNDGIVLSEKENVDPKILGPVVDYMTRFMTGSTVVEAFSVSVEGARVAENMIGQNSMMKVAYLLSTIKGTDDMSITNACKAAAYDVWGLNPIDAIMPETVEDPDAETIENIRVMIQRGITFFKEYGPVTKNGFTFEEKGYTDTVDAGEGDFLTKDTLWDFKVTRSKPNGQNTLQLLMYWIMGQHSEKPEFKGITKLGIFNPRLNTVYTLDIAKVPSDIIRTVEREVICY